MEYKPTIGLEIHAELKTKTKMFCGCVNNPDEKHPNFNVCPVCLAHPGVLPTINKEAVKNVLKLGLAVNGNLSKQSKFDRKNYFYPDLSKGYQISQYDQPLVFGGELKGIRIRRIHIEEDTGRLLHELPAESGRGPETSAVEARFTAGQASSGRQEKNYDNFSLVDFNRAGIPLMELVTEPDITSGKEAVQFAKELQLILRYLGISDADMEKGHMRIEANISLREIAELRGKIKRKPALSPFGPAAPLGTKVEVKNINSFAAVEKAVDYEIKRQAEILEKGEKVVQETRGWDDKRKKTVSQRLKEEAHDYRYFPEPDLPLLDLSENGGVFDIQELELSIPELPEQKRLRFKKEFKLGEVQVGLLAENIDFSDYFENAASELAAKTDKPDIQTLYNYLTSDLKGIANEKGVGLEQMKVSPEHFAHLIFLASSNSWSSRMVKEVLKEMCETGEDPENIMKAKSFNKALSGNEIESAVVKIIAGNPKAVSDFLSGQENALQFLVGQAMAKLKGRANPLNLRELFKNKIKSNGKF